MTIFKRVADEIETAVKTINADADISRMTVETPRDPSHGDLATNAAMLLAKPMGMNPRELAQQIIDALSNSETFESLEIAGPGFINMRLTPKSLCLDVKTCLESGTSYGEVNVGNGEKVNIEYVSANPTGPLTVGHARGAIVGDSLSRLLLKAGYDVQKEYYTNDFGNQINILTQTASLRYDEAKSGKEIEIPKGYYPGEYMKDVAQHLVTKYPEKPSEDIIRDETIAYMMEEIKKDLNDLGVQHDLFYSESKMVSEGKVGNALDALTKLGLIYEGVLEPPKGKKPDDWEEREQTLFRSTDYGDDVDRPLKKSDGTYTYFANDIAHYYDIHKMGYPTLVNVVGADHGGYVKRAKAAVDAISQSNAKLNFLVCQIVHTFDNGEPVRMSKRAGTFVTLRDMMDRVGPDVMRFIMLTRKSDQVLEFDFAKVKETSKDNPVFYVQYAHARCCSVMRHAADMFDAANITDEKLAQVDMSVLSDAELEVVKVLINWPRIVEQAAQAFEPHRVAFYLQDVAAAFHSWWNKGKDDTTLRFLQEDKKDLTLARLAVVRAVATTIASGLDVLGVEPMEEMRSEVSDAA